MSGFKHSVDLDELDFNILNNLQEDGRKSFTDIAEILKVSVGTVRTRITKLLDEKTLQVIGRVDTRKVGFNSYGYISIKVRPIDKLEEVAIAISKLPEVSFLAEVSGNIDLEVNVMCRDNDHLSEVLKKIRHIEGVENTQTSMYLRVIKYSQPDLTMLKK